MKQNLLYTRLREFLILLLLIVTAGRAEAEIRLPVIFSDGVVLQRGEELTIHGWADAKERVTLEFNGETYRTKADRDGNWSVDLPPQEAGGPYEMIFSGKNRVKVSNILIGDVWLCAGQSNMVLPMERVKEKYPEEIAGADYPEIRHFFISTTTGLTGPNEDLPPGEWKSANPEDLLGFSATAYFFAKRIYEKYGIPIGLINASVGGTPVEAWTSEEGFSGSLKYLEAIERNKDSDFLDSIRSLPEPPQRESKDKGILEKPKWFEQDYDPKGWYPINIPGYWEDQGVKNLNGVVWYRREIDVPASMTGKPAKLFMGRIIDADFVYVNGKKVGNITYQYPPRRYQIPEDLLKAGKNTIVIRVINYHGKGGFVPDKPYYLTAGGEDIDLKGTWMYKVGEVFEPAPFSGFRFSAQNQPTALYNAMIAPLINTRIKGFLWYQGESNAGRPKEYTQLLANLIADWRSKWNARELPFLYVQLANFMDVNYLPEESNWAELRYSQFRVLSVPNTAMAVAIDIGEWNDIHPLNKKDVGERLALGALKLAYNEDIVHSGPLYESAEISGDRVILSFSSVGSGLAANDGEPLRRFEIAGADGKFRWAKAKINGKKVEVWNEEVKNPVQVRYVWSDNPRGANLYNKEGLPASPFQTEKLD
ncbi:MAG: sialate O-acetylesterase [Bacteroidales bacterium]|nr:sialate O-acetylesterase [Bacteroidales bacterium]